MHYSPVSKCSKIERELRLGNIRRKNKRLRSQQRKTLLFQNYVCPESFQYLVVNEERQENFQVSNLRNEMACECKKDHDPFRTFSTTSSSEK